LLKFKEHIRILTENYVIQDGNLITGQNPASSELVAEKLLESLK